MPRVYNFSAGPGILPEQVLQEAAYEMTNYAGSGMSVLEMSHRSDIYQQIHQDAVEGLRNLAAIPENYEVLFLQGGASLQFAMVPLNLMHSGVADYIVTGHWAKKAWQEACHYGIANVIADGERSGYSNLPECGDLPIHGDAAYVHICQNNTIYGTQFFNLPDTKGKSLVADMSSCLLGGPVDISRYGLIYAGAQKNMGPAGVAVVIVRKDLIAEPLPGTPTMLHYGVHASQNSMYNTPPTFGIYLCGKVFRWLKNRGGLAAVGQYNGEKAAILYDYLDASRLFYGTAAKADRSVMNVTFTTGDPSLDRQFLQEAKKAGLVNLKGHRSVGGMRASLYNAMPKAGVEKLAQFMWDFEKRNQ